MGQSMVPHRGFHCGDRFKRSDLETSAALPAVCTALTAVCKLINADLVTAVLGPVVKLLDHPRELVRKK